MRRSHSGGNSMAMRRKSDLRRAKRELHRAGTAMDGAKAEGILAAFGMGTGGSGAKKDYRQFAREAYTRCVIAYRSIQVIAKGASMVPWYVTIDGKQVENQDEPLTALLRRPNPSQGTSAFVETMVSWLLLSGNSYPVRMASEEPTSRNTPRSLELEILRSDRMTPVIDKDKRVIIGWKYTVGNTVIPYPVDPNTGQGDVLQLKSFNPVDDVYGLSPVQPLSYGIDRHNAGNEWNYRLVKQSARPSGVVEHAPPEGYPQLTKEQRDRVRRQLRNQVNGEFNAGNNLLLEGYMKWHQMGLSPTDMDFSNAMADAARQIAAGYGVAPLLVGIPGNDTFANYKEARLALWEDTITPVMSYIRDEFNNWLVDGFGDKVRIDYDLDAVPAMAERRVALWEKLEAVSFLSMNEKREGAGYEEVEGGDVILVNAGQIPLDATGAGDDDDDIPDGAEDIDPEEAGKAAYGR